MSEFIKFVLEDKGKAAEEAGDTSSTRESIQITTR